MNDTTKNSSEAPGRGWPSYAQAIMVTLPAGLAFAFTTFMVQPKLRDIFRATDWEPPSFFLTWIAAADWVVSYWFLPLTGIVIGLALLESSVPAWKRCRQWVLFILAAVLNTIALLALIVITVMALAAFPQELLNSR